MRNTGHRMRAVFFILLAIYACSLLPMIAIGFYNWPSADDYTVAFEAKEVFSMTGSIPAMIVQAARTTYHYYMHWTGYYFCEFVMAVAPSAFGEVYYAVVTIVILTVFSISMLYFFHALMTKQYGVQWYLAGSIALSVMIMIVQCMPDEGGARTEAFYWWPGAVNYMMMWSLGVLWCGLMISCICDEGRKRTWDYLCACVLGLLLGGANFMTGLTLAIVSVVMIVSSVMGKVAIAPVPLAAFPIFPCFLNLAGFAAACLAPGNWLRGGFGQGFPAIKSIAISLYYTLDYCMDDWTTWVVICMMLLLAVLLWMAAREVSESEGTGTLTHFGHPVIVCILAYGLISANMTPILFTRGNIGAGRMQSIIWAQYILLLVLAMGYCIGYAVQVTRRKHVLRLDADVDAAARKERLLGRFAGVLVLFIVFGSAMCIGVNSHYYTISSAVTDLMNGSAVQYRAESWERLRILQDDAVTDAVIPAYTSKPELLFFSDATPDPDDWLNTSMAEYYHKESVRVE